MIIVRFEIHVSLDLHLMTLRDRILEYFQGHGLVTRLVIRVAAGQETLDTEEVRRRYKGQPPCRLVCHEHT